MVVNTVEAPRPDVTDEGRHFIKQWLLMQRRVDDAKKEVTRAECDFANAETALAKWLAPSDITPGEKIGVWYGDSLFQVESVENKSYAVCEGAKGDGTPIIISYMLKVSIRTRGKHFRELTW